MKGLLLGSIRSWRLLALILARTLRRSTLLYDTNNRLALVLLGNPTSLLTVSLHATLSWLTGSFVNLHHNEGKMSTYFNWDPLSTLSDLCSNLWLGVH